MLNSTEKYYSNFRKDNVVFFTVHMTVPLYMRGQACACTTVYASHMYMSICVRCACLWLGVRGCACSTFSWLGVHVLHVLRVAAHVGANSCVQLHMLVECYIRCS